MLILCPNGKPIQATVRDKQGQEAHARSALYSVPSQTSAKAQPDALLVERIHQLIQQHPTYGYRRVWALLRYREGHLVNRKRIYRLMRVKRWMLHHRIVTPKPRVQKLRSPTVSPVSRL